MTSGDVVLDPYCGTGTTLIECMKKGYVGIGFDANPVAHLATSVKTNPMILFEDPKLIEHYVEAIVDRADALYQSGQWNAFITDFEREKLIWNQGRKVCCIDELDLGRAIGIRQAMDEYLDRSPVIRQFIKLAFLKAVTDCANLKFAPEVTVLYRKEKPDLYEQFAANVYKQIEDMKAMPAMFKLTKGFALLHDSREPIQIDYPVRAVLCSPPYPNDKDYTRATRLELILGGWISDYHKYRDITMNLLASHSKARLASNDDARYVADIPEVQAIAAKIEEIRIKRGDSSGFQKNYCKVPGAFFGGMARHLQAIWPLLADNARLAYVVGDQASYYRVPIQTAKILETIAVKLGYKSDGIHEFRTRAATVTSTPLAENILYLRKPRLREYRRRRVL